MAQALSTSAKTLNERLLAAIMTKKKNRRQQTVPLNELAYEDATGETSLQSTARNGNGESVMVGEFTEKQRQLIDCARRTPEQTAVIRDANMRRLHAEYQMWKDEKLFAAMNAKQIEKDTILALKLNMAYAPAKDEPSASDLHTTLMKDHQASKDAGAARRHAKADLARAIKLSMCCVK